MGCNCSKNKNDQSRGGFDNNSPDLKRQKTYVSNIKNYKNLKSIHHINEKY